MTNNNRNVLSVDVEDWFHILDSPAVPDVNRWPLLPSRVEASMDTILEILDITQTKATFFWLGWVAERFPTLVKRCEAEGHEIASHGYAHVLAYKVGHQAFTADLIKAKRLLEDITGKAVHGFRAPGFGITDEATWAFDVIKSVGHEYDSSVFPAARGHGGVINAPIGPYVIETASGILPEVPMSVVEFAGKRFSFFGGGYLRLAPLALIHWGMRRVHKSKRPVVIYTHPRELDPQHPRLPLSKIRSFKSYFNLKTTRPKLLSLCERYEFITMRELVHGFVRETELQKSVRRF